MAANDSPFRVTNCSLSTKQEGQRVFLELHKQKWPFLRRRIRGCLRSSSSFLLYRTTLLRHWVNPRSSALQNFCSTFTFQISLFVSFCECVQAQWLKWYNIDLVSVRIKVQIPSMLLSCGCVSTPRSCVFAITLPRLIPMLLFRSLRI